MTKNQRTQISVVKHKFICCSHKGCWGSECLFRAGVLCEGPSSQYFKHLTKGQNWVIIFIEWVIKSHCHILQFKMWKSFLTNEPYENMLQEGFFALDQSSRTLLLEDTTPCSGSASQATSILWPSSKSSWLCSHYGSERTGCRFKHQQLTASIQKWHTSLPLWLHCHMGIFNLIEMGE